MADDAGPVSKTQIDRLGERLRNTNTTDADLRLLDAYRRSFAPVYDRVVDTVRGIVGLQPTGRPAKSTKSIIEKLQRDSIRLSQMQDIAGCRLVVSDILEQDRVARALQDAFGVDAVIVDRRTQPSHGYRAVHLIIRYADKPIEIQIRTSLQHLWAELSEKISDVFEPGIKYGKSDSGIATPLEQFSRMIADLEEEEKTLAESGAEGDSAAESDFRKSQHALRKRALTDGLEKLVNGLKPQPRAG